MATIKDVAREAAVSVATVSRVFNQSGLVSEETRRHVRAVAERLRYWPNGVARSLITSRTHALGVLLPDLHGEFFSEVIRGLDLTARERGLHLLLSSSHSDPEGLVAALRSMRGRVDGLILMAPEIDAISCLEESASSLPLVLLDPGNDVEGYDTVSIGNLDGARGMVRHLLGLGHRRVAIVAGPDRNIDARQRLEGWRAALTEAGLAATDDLVLPGDFTERSGYEAGVGLLRLDPRPSAVFAANDYMAVGVMRALGDSGLRVPEDVAVAGFDDIELARYLDPALTTVHVDAFGLGRRAVQRLAPGDGDGAPRHRRETLETTLIVRASCGSGTGAETRDGRPRIR
jgi:LacI family transcriptional regulator